MTRLTRVPSSSLRLTGADRLDFAQGQMTGDIKRAPVPGMTPALFLNVRGQIEFFARVYRRQDDLYLHLDAGQADLLEARLRRYIIFDQVTVENLSDTLTTVHLWGEQAESALPGWDAAGPDVQEVRLDGLTLLAARVRRSGPGLDVHVLSREQDVLLSALQLEEASWDALQRARVQAGIPDAVADRFTGNLPQEVGLDFAVSYQKGCYVGQEIMARLEARGNARYHLAVLEGENLPSHTEVFVGERKVGSTGLSNGDRVLASLRKELEEGAAVQLGEVTARVRLGALV
ncbi:hypothetical protein HNR42_001652 [Deinobacterium chartae]|uniref:Aminomethyltransferase folate-binding domain-containing protein n=1 Tax=Deinobacterium chartae TaxID=521158 RepID=A0A841HXU3_9DEIO|nr:folate-binding protein YgfZ [Deinobacterium chartae]MBB6098227.1 hypothetical protein [Deinobacterium chartae]